MQMGMKQSYNYLWVILVFSSCSLLDISDDTYNARFPSKDLDKPQDLLSSEALRSVQKPTI